MISISGCMVFVPLHPLNNGQLKMENGKILVFGQGSAWALLPDYSPNH